MGCGGKHGCSQEDFIENYQKELDKGWTGEGIEMFVPGTGFVIDNGADGNSNHLVGITNDGFVNVDL